MLEVHTQEVYADFTGFPLEVTSPPTVQFEDAPVAGEIIIDAGERDDGALGQRLVLRGYTKDLARVFREALTYVEGVE